MCSLFLQACAHPHIRTHVRIEHHLPKLPLITLLAWTRATCHLSWFGFFFLFHVIVIRVFTTSPSVLGPCHSITTCFKGACLHFVNLEYFHLVGMHPLLILERSTASLKQTTIVKMLYKTLKKITMGRIKVEWGKNDREWILKYIMKKFFEINI